LIFFLLFYFYLYLFCSGFCLLFFGAVPTKFKLQSISIFGIGLHMKLSFYLILNCLLLCIFHNFFPVLACLLLLKLLLFLPFVIVRLCEFCWPWVGGSVGWASGNVFWSRGRMCGD